MATLNRTFSVKNGIDVANTIIVDSSRNLSNIVTANAVTVNANTYLTVAGLNVTDQANAAYSAANLALINAGQANVVAKDAYAQANAARDQANTGLGQANAAYAQANAAYGQANTARDVANAAYGQANAAYGQANAGYTQANTARTTANDAYAQANAGYTQANTARTTANDAYAAANTSGNTVRVSANAGSTLSNKQLNFNNSASIQVTVADSGGGNANITFITTGAAVADAYEQANAAANTVATFANGTIVLAKGNLNFNNTSSVNVAASANGSTQSNIAFDVNTASFTSIGVATAPITLASNVTVSKDLTVSGNLRVEGDTTTFNVGNLAIEDSEIILNSNQSGSPTLNASIFAERGSSNDTFIRWNETADKWGWSDDGTLTYYFEDLNQGLVTHNTTFSTVNTTFGTVNTTLGTLNTTFGTTNTTFGTVNTNITNVNANGLNAYAQANAAYGQANAAYGQANTARTTANDAYAAANTANTNALNAYGQANAAYSQANTSHGQANAAYAQANAAYADANTRVLKSGDTMTGNLTITTSGIGLRVANANITYSLQVGTLNVTSNTVTTSSSGQVVLDKFPTTQLASAKYFVQVKSEYNDYHTTEVVLVQDATNVFITEYGSIQTGPSLGSFSADISSGDVRLLFNATNNVNTIRAVRYGIIP